MTEGISSENYDKSGKLMCLEYTECLYHSEKKSQLYYEWMIF